VDDAMIAAASVFFIQEDRSAQLYEPGKNACDNGKSFYVT